MTTTISAANPHNFAQLKCSPTTLICREKTVILGDVTIGADCVIHPTVNIIAKAGPIVIGNSNLIEERVNIINNRKEPMVVGDHNVFEVDCRCEAARVGDHNVMEAKSVVGPIVEISDNCIIGAGCAISDSQVQGNDVDNSQKMRKFPPNTVVSGRNPDIRVVRDLPVSSQISQLDFLRKILPNYQKLWRPMPANAMGTPTQPK